jgi:DUF1365 family protein
VKHCLAMKRVYRELNGEGERTREIERASSESVISFAFSPLVIYVAKSSKNQLTCFSFLISRTYVRVHFYLKLLHNRQNKAWARLAKQTTIVV